ncbi:MAG: hypothetical protein JXR78_01695 [Victivallales bacterium]|nr:hypothetical protein [Victivallales bacterium]
MKWSKLVFLGFIFCFLFAEVVNLHDFIFIGDEICNVSCPDRTHSILNAEKHIPVDCSAENPNESEGREEREERLRNGAKNLSRKMDCFCNISLDYIFAKYYRIPPRHTPWQSAFVNIFCLIFDQLKTVILVV